MIPPRAAFALTFLFYLLDASYGGWLRKIGKLKFGALALLLVSATTARPDRRVKADMPSILLVAAFGLFGAIATWSSTFGPTHPLKLAGVVLLLFGTWRLAAVWIASGGFVEFERMMVRFAVVVTWTNVLLLLAGRSLGRGEGRFTGWLSNPNTLSAALALVAPFVLARALDRRSPGIRSERLLLVAILVLMFASGSRAGILAFLVSGAIYAWCTERVKGGTIAFGAVMIAILSLLWPTISPYVEDVPLLRRFASTPAEEQEVIVYEDEQGAMEFSGSGREVAWPLAIRLLEQRPLFGWGWGTEEGLLDRFQEQVLTHQGRTFHNSYLSLLVHVGWIGALPIFALILRLLWRGLREAARVRGPAERVGGVPVIVGTFAGAVVYGVFESALFSSGNSSAPLIWLTGFSCGVVQHLEPEAPETGDVA